MLQSYYKMRYLTSEMAKNVLEMLCSDDEETNWYDLSQKGEADTRTE